MCLCPIILQMLLSMQANSMLTFEYVLGEAACQKALAFKSVKN